MNKIKFPRIGVDGVLRSQHEIEDNFYNTFFMIIDDNLKKLRGQIQNQVPANRPAYCQGVNTAPYLNEISWIRKNLKCIILSSPRDLESLVNATNANVSSPLGNMYFSSNKQTDFGSDILKAFNYKNFREYKLQKLGRWLNIICCPYCNLHYTLYVLSNDKRINGARYQFDHFYSKKRYPFLSMSLYNLIPSCPICNQRKSNIDLPIQFNPYYGEIASYFTFKVKNPLPLFVGKKEPFKINKYWNNYDSQVRLITQGERDTFDKMTNLKEQYSRLNDVAEEVFAKAYLEKYYYYSDFFKDIPEFSYSLKKRVMHGTYMNPQDIDKRPLTKLYQDLWKQAMYIRERVLV